MHFHQFVKFKEIKKTSVLKEASEMVDEVLEADPALCTPENRILKKKMDEFAKEQLKRMNL